MIEVYLICLVTSGKYVDIQTDNIVQESLLWLLNA